MSLHDKKIYNWVQPVSSLQDRPKMTAKDLKAAFDSNSNEIKKSINGIVEELTSAQGAENIGINDICGLDSRNVQQAICFLADKLGSINPSVEIPLSISSGGTSSKSSHDAIYKLGATPNKNILNNWYFKNTINQRGQTSYTGAVYGIDRWKGIYGSETVNVFDDKIQIVVSGNQGVGQYIEFPHLLANKRVTLSILWSLDGDYANFGCSNSFENFGSIGIERSFGLTLSSITFNIGDNISQLKTVISGQGNINVYAVKLEIGESQTLARQNSNGLWDLLEIPDYQTELLKCQRYYYKSIYDNNGLGVSIRISSGSHYIPFKTTMRTVPNIRLYGETRYITSSLATQNGFILSNSDGVYTRACDFEAIAEL